MQQPIEFKVRQPTGALHLLLKFDLVISNEGSKVQNLVYFIISDFDTMSRTTSRKLILLIGGPRMV